MKTVVVLSTLLLAIASAYVFFGDLNKNRDKVPSNIAREYSLWKVEFGKLYGTPAEESFRLKVFYTMHEFVRNINRNYEEKAKITGQVLSGPMFELNQFGDLTDEEFTARYTNNYLEEPTEEKVFENEERLDDETTGQVLAPSDPHNLGQKATYEIRPRSQGGCGSCWVFAGVACIEKLYFDRTGRQMDFSQQEIVDCSQYGNGCKGGSAHAAYKYIQENGISLASKYPYVGSEGVCVRKPQDAVKMNLTPDGNIQYTLEKAKSKVIGQKMFISVTVAGSRQFSFLARTADYIDGNISGDCEIKSNHAVALIEIDDKDLLTILNSWGPKWGNNGTKKIKACSNTNIHGSAARISYPA